MTEEDAPIGHEPITTRTPAGALKPIVCLPYCGRCRVAWPCPHADAHRRANNNPDPAA